MDPVCTKYTSDSVTEWGLCDLTRKDQQTLLRSSQCRNADGKPQTSFLLSLSFSLLLQHPATLLHASCFDSHSIFRWHWTEKIIFLLPPGSCSCTDMENYFRGSLNHKHYFCFHFILPLISPTPLLFTLPLSNSFNRSGEALPEPLRERSVWEIWPVCPFHA